MRNARRDFGDRYISAEKLQDPDDLPGVQVEEPPNDTETTEEIDDGKPPELPQLEYVSATDEAPPIDGRCVVLIFENGDRVAAVAKSTRAFIRGQGWQRQVRWIDAMSGTPINEEPAGWRPWEPGA